MHRMVLIDVNDHRAMRPYLLDRAIRNLMAYPLGREIILMLLHEPVSESFVADSIRSEFARLSNSMRKNSARSSPKSEKPSA